MAWRSRSWVHCIGWTLVFSAVFVVTAGLILPPLIAAFLIGARLGTWWWVAGPLITGTLVLGFGLLLASAASGSQSGYKGPSYAPAYAEYFGTLIAYGGGLIGILSSLAALAGVGWGKRRNGADVESRSVVPADGEST
jgi:hypothetical protein